MSLWKTELQIDLIRFDWFPRKKFAQPNDFPFIIFAIIPQKRKDDILTDPKGYRDRVLEKQV